MISPIIAAVLFNLSDFMTKPFYYSFNPYTNIIGDFFFASLILIIGAGIYLGTDKNSFIVAIYLMIASVLMGTILPFHIAALIVFIAAIIVTILLYKQFAVRKVQ